MHMAAHGFTRPVVKPLGCIGHPTDMQKALHLQQIRTSPQNAAESTRCFKNQLVMAPQCSPEVQAEGHLRNRSLLQQGRQRWFERKAVGHETTLRLKAEASRKAW